MKLDLTKPTIVVTGAWNAAIFQAGWIARNLFDLPEGTQFRAHKVLQIAPARELTYINRVGIQVSNSRLEVFCNEMTAETQALAEQVATRAIDILSHTPINALGVNFSVKDAEASQNVIDSLTVNDQLSEHYKILSQELKAHIEMDDCVLNLKRESGPEGVAFDFNFHFDELRSKLEILGGVIQTNIGRAKALLNTVYEIDNEWQGVGHDFDSHRGEIGNE